MNVRRVIFNVPQRPALQVNTRPTQRDRPRGRGSAAQTQDHAEVPCLVLTGAALAARVATCPFRPTDGKLVHGLLVFGPVTIDEARLAGLRAPSESLVPCPGVVWLHAPDGFGRSKLAERLDRVVSGALFTARNLNTLQALVGLAGGGVGDGEGGASPSTR